MGSEWELSNGLFGSFLGMHNTVLDIATHLHLLLLLLVVSSLATAATTVTLHFDAQEIFGEGEERAEGGVGHGDANLMEF